MMIVIYFKQAKAWPSVHVFKSETHIRLCFNLLTYNHNIAMHARETSSDLHEVHDASSKKHPCMQWNESLICITVRDMIADDMEKATINWHAGVHDI